MAHVGVFEGEKVIPPLAPSGASIFCRVCSGELSDVSLTDDKEHSYLRLC